MRPRIIFPKLIESARCYRLTDIRHQPLVEADIMQGNEDGAKHLAGEKVMTDRPTGKMATGVTVARGLNGLVIPGK